MVTSTYATVDQGNTQIKFGVFQNGQLIHHFITLGVDHSILRECIDHYGVEALIYSNVADESSRITNFGSTCKVIEFCSNLKLPVETSYDKIETMGSDRIAAAAGLMRYTGPLRVSIDFGTCTTITVVKHNTIVNGSIAPGRMMRYRALHEFTGRLPLLSLPMEISNTVTTSTEETIHHGVSVASVVETENLLRYLLDFQTPDSLVITGGDHAFFEHHLKTPNFADPHLVLKGLHAILLENI